MAACWITLFHRLDAAPMRTWDETRLAINAIEMVETGEPLVTYYHGRPENWNTKPPLMIWLQAISVKVLGIQTLAFRLPAALAALATVLLVFVFAYRNLKEPWTPLLAVMLLLSTEGYILTHCARHGEYDSLLVLWVFASSVAFFKFVQSPAEGQWIWLAALFVTMAVYTKGVQGLLHVPGLLIYAALSGRFKRVIREWRVYAAGLATLVAVAAYYIAREQLQPGYLQAVWNNELFGRYATVIEGHRGDFLFYILDMKLWSPLILMALPALLIKGGQGKSEGVFAIVVALSYLLVISFATSKVPWYEVPTYPFLALFAAIAVKRYMGWLRGKQTWAMPTLAAITAVVTAWYFGAMVYALNNSYDPEYREEHYRDQLAHFFKTFPETRQVVFGIAEYDAPATYYYEYYASRSIELELRWPDLTVQPGDTLLTSADEIKERMRANPEAEIIFEHSGMEAYVIRK